MRHSQTTVIVLLLFLYRCQAFLNFNALAERIRPPVALDQTARPEHANKIFDVVIVGGSAAGLSAALSLGRSLRQTLVIDSGNPCNEYQGESHNLLGFDGVSPNEILAKARENVMQYVSVELRTGEVENIQRTSPNNKLFSMAISQLQDEAPEIIHARSIILATGVRDILPTNISGLQECWGKSVIHCPYCHGYEFHSKRTALWMSVSNTKQMMPILRTTFTDRICVVGGKQWEDDEEADALRTQLEQRNITVHRDPMKEIKHKKDGMMTSIVLEDGSELPMDCVYIRPPMEQRFGVEQLELSMGETLELNDKGYICVDSDTQKTSVEGIMACGDCTTPNRALSVAIACGTRAAKMLNFELATDDWQGGGWN